MSLANVAPSVVPHMKVASDIKLGSEERFEVDFELFENKQDDSPVEKPSDDPDASSQ